MKYQQSHISFASYEKCMNILEALRLISNGPTHPSHDAGHKRAVLHQQLNIKIFNENPTLNNLTKQSQLHLKACQPLVYQELHHQHFEEQSPGNAITRGEQLKITKTLKTVIQTASQNIPKTPLPQNTTATHAK